MSMYMGQQGIRTTRRILQSLSGARGGTRASNGDDQWVDGADAFPSPNHGGALHRRSLSAGTWPTSIKSMHPWVSTPEHEAPHRSPEVKFVREPKHLTEEIAESTDDPVPDRARVIRRRLTAFLKRDDANRLRQTRYSSDSRVISHAATRASQPPVQATAESVRIDSAESVRIDSAAKLDGVRIDDEPTTITAPAKAVTRPAEAKPAEADGRTLLQRLSSILQHSAQVCSTGIAVELALSEDPATQAKGLVRFKEGVASGNPSLIYNLGLCYETGKLGVIENMALARQCYKTAADMGHAQSQYNLGLMYYQSGKRRSACKLFKRAHDAGLQEASIAWALCLCNSKSATTDSDVDAKEAVCILTKLAAAGNTRAARQLKRIGPNSTSDSQGIDRSVSA